MNVVLLCGRLVRDPELRYSSSSNVPMVRFTLAVDRQRRDDGADFIECKAFNTTAEFISRHYRKGVRTAVFGHIQTGSYEKDGRKVYTTEVVCESVELFDKPQPSETPENAPAQQPASPKVYNAIDIALAEKQKEQGQSESYYEGELPF